MKTRYTVQYAQTRSTVWGRYRSSRSLPYLSNFGVKTTSGCSMTIWEHNTCYTARVKKTITELHYKPNTCNTLFALQHNVVLRSAILPTGSLSTQGLNKGPSLIVMISQTERICVLHYIISCQPVILKSNMN